MVYGIEFEWEIVGIHFLSIWMKGLRSEYGFSVCNLSWTILGAEKVQ